MNKDDLKRADLGNKTLLGFFAQFGNDPHAQILLEELFKGLIDEEALFIFGEQIKEGHQTGDDSSDARHSELQSDGIEVPEPPNHMGKENRPDYP